eukprot:234064-Prymnesium_polylepis.1
MARGREQLQQEAGEAAPAAKLCKQQEATGGPRKRSGWRGRQRDRRRRRPPAEVAAAKCCAGGGRGAGARRGLGWLLWSEGASGAAVGKPLSA